jgi:hypothetical protein
MDLVTRIVGIPGHIVGVVAASVDVPLAFLLSMSSILPLSLGGQPIAVG